MPLKILGYAGWKIRNATLSSFVVLISYLLAYIQWMVSKLNGDHDGFGRNSLGYPHILPHVMLDISTFSVVLIDFSGPCLIGSRNSFSVSQSTLGQFHSPHLYHPTLPSPSPDPQSPGPCPWLLQPISSCSRAIQHSPLGLPVTSARPHTPQCWCEGRKTVWTTKAKEGGTTAAKQLLILLPKQGSFLTLLTVHSLDKGQPPPCCSGQAEHWSETQAPGLLLVIRHFLSLRPTSRLAVATIRALDRKLKIEFENLRLYNIRMKSKNLRQGTTLLCTHEAI